MVSALTWTANGRANSIVTPVMVKNALSSSTVATLGLWDTGAQSSAITEKMASALGLPILSKATVRGVHGVKEVNVYLIEIILNNPRIAVKCQVTGCDELSDDGKVGVLLGMNVITMGDFVVSNFEGRTTMTFRVPSLRRTDYVEEVNEYNRLVKIHASWIKSGNNKCPCGSGKKWENCHGKSIYK